MAPPNRLLVAIPNWVGDVVLATPTFAALRAGLPDARITFLMRRYVSDVVAGGGWHDDELHWPATNDVRGFLRLVRQVREQRYDAVLLLTNSYRSTLLAYFARISRRVGYAREWRGWMLTERLRPPTENGVYKPSSVLPYYAALAEQLGCRVADRRLRLGITAEQEASGAELMKRYGLGDGRPYAIINPGAAFGASKCWLPERFANLCDRLRDEFGMIGVIVGAPNEAPLMRAIADQTRGEVICCDKPHTTLGSLKVLARGARLMVCNDTGPRHYAAAFNVPTVTIFGPTHQAWTDTDYDREIKLQISVECGPCQLKTCPLDHRCMTGISVEMVAAKARDVLARVASLSAASRAPAQVAVLEQG